METKFDSSVILLALREAPNDIFSKQTIVKAYMQAMVENGASESECAQVICKIIEDGKYVGNVNAIAISALAKVANLTGKGVAVICQNLYKNYPDIKKRFISCCKIEKLADMEKLNADGIYNDLFLRPSATVAVTQEQKLSAVSMTSRFS